MVAYYLGPPLSYTHSAAKRFAKEEELIASPTINHVFQMISNDDDLGIIPLENSIFGSVLETIDSLRLFPHICISSETTISINHCIATARPVVTSEIKRVVSHPQALGQCSNWIDRKLNKDIERVESSSTARAAMDVAKSQSDDTCIIAAICSKECADFYGLYLLEDSIQNSSCNMTRFIKLQKQNSTKLSDQNCSNKTLISFTVDHNQPGALSKALLALNQVQLTRIDSRPSHRNPWEYTFYIEMIGHHEEDLLSMALLQVENVTDSYAFHGSFSNSGYLYSNAYCKLMNVRGLRIATARPPKRFQLSQSSGGLGSVLNKPALVVTRQLEMLNVLIGFEQANKYAIKSFDGADVGFIIEEDSSFLKSIVRQMLLTRRSFNASILDGNGQVVLKIRRPIKWFLNSEISVYNANDELLGEVKQVWHLWRRQYELFLGKKQFAAIDTGFLGWDFQLTNERGEHLASVNRAFSGFAREIFTDTGSYAIHFEHETVRKLSLKERAVVLSCAINIDIDYFSRHSGRGGFFPFFYMGGGSESDLTSNSATQDSILSQSLEETFKNDEENQFDDQTHDEDI